jgi:hypothetical protein
MENTVRAAPYSFRFIRNVILKSVIFFLVCNLIYIAINPIDSIGRISAYNLLFPGRKRLPFGERPESAYNLTMDNLPAMLASHEIEGVEKHPAEFRVVVIGDSSVWGYLLPPDDTLSAQINQANLILEGGRRVRAYNLGYPTLSVTKDLFIVSHALRYQPDLVLWIITLEALPWEKQLATPILRNNLDDVGKFHQEWQLDLNRADFPLPDQAAWKNTLPGQRRALADWFRLQLYGVLWAATGIDQVYSEDVEPPQWDLESDDTFYGLTPEKFEPANMAFSIIYSGIQKIGPEKVLLVNEPIFVSSGQNSDIRYNSYYPRWVYDEYRRIMTDTSQEYNWRYLDTWNIVPADDFTNSAIHINQHGTSLLAREILRKISETPASGIANRLDLGNRRK